MIKKFFALALLTGVVSAHEFWLEPQSFQGREVHVRVGENFHGEAWKGSGRRVVEIRDHYAGKVRRLRLQGTQFRLPADQPGVHLVTFRNDNSFITLGAEKFNEYLKEDGLENALEWRAAHGQEDKPGREFYRRCVKSLIRVGGSSDGSNYGLDTGLPLELIALTDPYAGKAPAEMRFRVQFKHRLVKNALVQVWHRGDGRSARLQLRSDAQGEVTFPCWQVGRWMVSSVHMERVPPGQRADWQSYWSSYTFGFE